MIRFSMGRESRRTCGQRQDYEEKSEEKKMWCLSSLLAQSEFIVINVDCVNKEEIRYYHHTFLATC